MKNLSSGSGDAATRKDAGVKPVNADKAPSRSPDSDGHYQ